MPTFILNQPWWWYVLWNASIFFVSLVPHSFMEWLSHRFVLHSKALVKFAYEEHDQSHHVEYGPDQTFEVLGKDYGVDFNVRDWLLFIAIVMPLWAGVEYLTGKPLLIGVFASTALWLHTFNVIHRHFHAPNGSWIERTWYYKTLKRHHRIHHADMTVNLNVVFPLADACLGTLRLNMPPRPNEGPPQKPVRSSGHPVAPCLICGRVVDDFCPDCARALCLRAECDRGHAAVCAPVHRAVMTRDAEWR